MLPKKKKKKKKRIVATLTIVVRACVAFILSLVSVCLQRVLSLYISLSLSLLQHKSSSVFVSSAVLLLLFSNFNHERKRKLTWWIYKFSPSLLTFVCIFLLKIHNAHTTHTHLHTHTRTLHTQAFIVGPTVCYHYLLSHCFTPHSRHIHFICWFVFV